MRSRCGRLVWPHLMATLLVVFGVNDCLAQGRDSWKERFLAEAPRKWEEYWTRSARFQGLGSLLSDAGDGFTCEFKQNRSAGCALGTGQDMKKGQPRDHYLVAINSRYEFELTRPDAQHPWVLVGWSLVPSGEALTRDCRANIGIDFFTHEALAFSTQRDQLPKLIKEPGFVVKAVTAVPEATQRLAKVEFDYQPPKELKSRVPHLRGGWILLDPERYWLPLRYEIRYQIGVDTVLEKGSEVGSYEYEAGRDGLPLLKRQRRRQTGSDSDGKPTEARVTFESRIVEADVAESEFFLSAYGLPEPIGMDRKKPIPNYVWILIGALVCAALAVGFRYFARRRRESAA